MINGARLGLFESLAHPGGNVTGTDSWSALAAAKRVALLKEIVPRERFADGLVWCAPARLAVSVADRFGPGSSTVDGLLDRFHPAAAGSLATALARAPVTPEPDLRTVYAMRVRASV